MSDATDTGEGVRRGESLSSGAGESIASAVSEAEGQWEWVSEEVIDAGGSAGIWLATPGSRAQEQQLAETMAAARAAEYQPLAAAAEAAAAFVAPASAVRRLRNDLRAIQRRDYFPPAARDQAEAAVG